MADGQEDVVMGQEEEVPQQQEQEEVECVLDDKPQRVVDGLYIGSAWSEMNAAALTKAGITDILQVARGLFPHHPLSFNYCVLQVDDAPWTDLVAHFPRCLSFIDAAIASGGAVLVHCAAGVSRSATIVLAFLMSRRGLSLAAALEHLKAVRPWVAPNPGFMAQLQAYGAAQCDAASCRPWHLVWAEQQEQQQQQDGGGLQPQQQPQQCWLVLPQTSSGGGPGSSSSNRVVAGGGQQPAAQPAAAAVTSSTGQGAPAPAVQCDGGGGGSSSSSRVRFAAAPPPVFGSNSSGSGGGSKPVSRQLSRNYSFGASLACTRDQPPACPDD